jgi:hypothetical protein
LASPSELGLVETSPSGFLERGWAREPAPEPFSILALTGRGGAGAAPGALSMSRSISASGRGELGGGGPRVLDIVRELLPARDGDVRESACLW